MSEGKTVSKSSSTARARAARWGIAAVAAGALLGGLALRSRSASAPVAARAEHRAGGAYRPERAAGPPALAGAKGAGAAAGALSPELEARLAAAAHVEVVPARTPSGAPLPPPPAPGSLSPESEAQRQQALAGWQREAQRLLDECVARPAALRQPVLLTVLLAPPAEGERLAPQRLAAGAVTIPPADLRRLWRDTDPDALQICLDRLRGLPLAVPGAPGAPAQVMPASAEPLQVQI